ncbi:MAG TPA: S9 family peptidase [Cytophagales bacterium]|nr:S9 family peptidase [Cytophagales bacterium]HAP58299.1 S9 family peptidase [Cytophagales bacterium]
MHILKRLGVGLIFLGSTLGYAQDASQLTLDKIYNSREFSSDWMGPVRWIADGEAYIAFEYSETGLELARYTSEDQTRSVFLSAAQLTPEGGNGPLNLEDFTLSDDESKVLIFTNSKRVWRSNTKGDYWVYDLDRQVLSQIGKDLPESSLMFAKFSPDNSQVSYVSDFNLYVENFATGQVRQLTEDGDRDIINGTFDWVYEEEFGARDGFRWSGGSSHIAYWQLDASEIKNFSMINNTESIYPEIIPVQYPKVGEDPSSARLGILDVVTGAQHWIPVPGDTKQNYLPGIQWVDDNTLLIQQLNRHQNHLKIYAYDVSTEDIRVVYEEKEETWVDISYPDLSANGWGDNHLTLVDDGEAFLRMTENDGWRHVYKVALASGEKTLLTPEDYDVASMQVATGKHLYYIASPDNSTQRYLYRVDLKGKGKTERLTPDEFEGVNTYDIASNGKYALHTHTSALVPNSVRLVSLPKHSTVATMMDNARLKQKLTTLNMPEVEFSKVTTSEGIEIDVRMIKPTNFDPSQRYPVLFHVYGEPWGQVATDSWVGAWNVFLAQQGYVIIDMDNRGTPCLKGSEWRKSIYRNIGRINIRDQALAAQEVLKLSYLDEDRTAVWGWSGGGSTTLNLMFQYPGVYKTGMAVAAVANQLTYDNIYQERYMGLPQENREDFVAGSPISHVEGLEGNLLIVHGTADDNVHYQNQEMLINKLIEANKQFDMMSYPNRSHGIYEGRNTRRHLYTMLTRYLMEHVPTNDAEIN